MTTSQSSQIESLASSRMDRNKQSTQTCLQHYGESYTNFCSSIRCFKPLCPECIDLHYEYHRNIKVKPEVDSFKSLRNKCLKKVLSILETIGCKSTELELLDDDSIEDNVCKVIREVKQNCLNLVGNFFNDLQSQTVNKLLKNRQSKSLIFSEFDKINSIIRQLKILSTKLDGYENEDFLFYAKSIVKLDQKKIIQSVKESYSYANQMAEFQKKNLYLMKNYDQKLSKFLSMIINYGERESVQTLSQKQTISVKGGKKPKSPKPNQTQCAPQSKGMFNSLEETRSAGQIKLLMESTGQQLQEQKRNQHLKTKLKMAGSHTYNNDHKSHIDELHKSTHNFKSPNLVMSYNEIMTPKNGTDQIIKYTMKSLSPMPIKQGEATERKVSRKRHQTSFTMVSKEVSQRNFFFDECLFKYLHFFQNDQNIMYLYSLQKHSPFLRVEINSDIRIPQFHKSIMTPDGNIYLIGGTVHQSHQKSNKILLYDFQQNTFKVVGQLFYARSSHSLCLSGDGRYIYILGGITNEGTVTSLCERFDTQTFRTQQIRPLNKAVCSFASCPFGQRYVCKFGGVSEDKSLVHTIEIYDEKHSTWRVIQPHIPTNILELLKVSTATATQISSSEIMVMGGYNLRNQGQKTTYFLRIGAPNKCQIIDINSHPLPFGEGFWASTPVVHNKKMYLLQNIANEADGNECIENFRKVLRFDGRNWQILN